MSRLAAFLTSSLTLSLSSPVQAAEIKVLTYNVAAIHFVHGKVGPRMARIAEKIKSDGYDVAAIQECWVKSCSDNLKQAFPHSVRLKEGITGGDGLLLGSRYPVRGAKTVSYSLDAPDHRILYGEGDGLSEKGVMAVTLDTPAGPLKVFNTHLIAGYKGRDYKPERAAQVYELIRFIREYAGKDPYILMGDMNFSPQTPHYGALVALLDLRDACPDCEDTDREGRIDHIFLSPAMSKWNVKRNAVSFKETLDEGGKVPLSDHFGFVVVLESPAPAAKPVYTLSMVGNPIHVLDIRLSKERALLFISDSLNAFTQGKSADIRLNLLIPLYGWLHAKWGLAQIDSASALSAAVRQDLKLVTKLVTPYYFPPKKRVRRP